MEAFLHNMDWAVAMRMAWLTPIFKGFTLLGYSTFLLLFLPFGFWVFNKNVFARATLLVILTALLNSWLKDYFQDPRPAAIYHLDPRVSNSWGFPSGHAQVATVLWMWIAWEVRRKWTWILCSVILLGICLSRLYLGVHDVEDILGGLFFGTLTLLVFGYLVSGRIPFLVQLHPVVQMLLLLLAEFVIFASWPGKPAIVLYGFGAILVGFWPGVLLERRRIRYTKHPDLWRVLLAGVLGIIIFILLKQGLGIAVKSLFPGNTVAGLSQAAILGFYISAIAPWGLVKLKLAEQQPEA